MSSMIRATNLRGYEDLVRRAGGDPALFLSKHQIPIEDRRVDTSFLLYRNFSALIEDTAFALDYPQFGLKLAQYQGIDILGPLSVIARSAATVGEAISSIGRYLYLHCPAISIHISKGNDRINFEFVIDDEKEGGYRGQIYELSLSNSIQVLSLLCGDSFRPTSVHFKHPQLASSDIYEDVFNCKPYFKHHWCGFYLSAHYFDTPLTSADHQTWQMAERYLASLRPPNTSSLSDKVIQLIGALLPTGHCSGEVVASYLSLHQRTLQRRLALEGVTYEQLLNEERKRIAQKYLLEPNLVLSQIAGLLGYSEQSAFNRACRHWFGITPKAYRAQLLQTSLLEKTTQSAIKSKDERS